MFYCGRDFRLTEDLEDIVDELEKEYLAKLKVLQDLKAEKDIIERRLKSRTAAIINLKEDRLLLVQKKKLKEQSIEEINQSLELDNQQEIKQLEFTLEELSRSVEDMEIKYQTTLDELENLKQAVETDGMQRISYALGSISSCQFSVGSMVANILFLIKIVFHACDGISSNITFVLRILGIFENWLSFLQAVLSSWLFLSISLLIALILKRFFNLLTSDLSTSFSFDILLILVFFQWKAEPTKDALALSMHWGLLSWIVFLLLFCSLLNGIRQFCYNSLCSFRDVMDIAGRIAVLLSFLGSCGNIPQSSKKDIGSRVASLIL
eukprot:jgi/Galph1/5588/GphlegSOOS_G4299.1